MSDTGDKLRDRVYRFISDNNLFFPGEKIVAAVSGGPDSVCLLHILNELKEKLNIKLHIAHLDHQLRGKESEADARYVSRLAVKMGIPATIEKKDVAAYRSKGKLSLEEAAREQRYGFFANVAEKENADCVVVAHTRDDDVETILMHILRGSGITGLRGLQPRSVLQMGEEKSCINVVRPLLTVTREETRQYCTQYKLRPRTDTSNLSTKFTRNRIRLELLPALKTYNPRIEDALLRLSAIADEEMLFLEEQAAQYWGDVAEEFDNAVALDIKKIIHMPVVLQRQFMRWAVKYLWGNTMDIEADHIEDMVRFMSKASGKTLCLPQGLRLNTEYGKLIVSRDDAEICPFPVLEGEHGLKVPGQTDIPGWSIVTGIKGAKGDYFEGNLVASFDARTAGTDLTVRARKQGDSFQPLGMKQSKSLQEFMVDAKIPRSWRERIPLVCSGGDILWVAGWRISDRFKISPGTRKILRIEFVRTT